MAGREANTNATVQGDGSSGVWDTWTNMSLAGRAIKFIETFCRPAKGHSVGRPLTLAEFQKEWIEATLSGEYQSSAMSVARGGGKSTFMGAFATWALFDQGAAEYFGGQPLIPIVAPTLKRGRKGVFGSASAFVRNHPELASRAHIYTANGNERIVCFSNALGEMGLHAANAYDLQGEDPSVSVIDEIGFVPYDVWDALLQSDGKRPHNLLVGIGTRSPGETDNILDFLLGQLKQFGSLDGFYLADYQAAEGRTPDDEDGWREANPLIDAGLYNIASVRKRKNQTHPALFQCYTMNQKIAAIGGWLGEDGPLWWDQGVTADELNPELPVRLGVDKSKKGDCSAVTAIQLRPDGTYLVVTRIFPADPVVDHKAVRDHIRHMCATYTVEMVGYDDRYFVEGAEELAAEGLPMVDIPQNAQRLAPAYSELYQLFAAGKIVHHDDRLFRSHVLGATADNNLMLKKDPKTMGKIDACVAMGIAFATYSAELPKVVNSKGKFIDYKSKIGKSAA